MTITFDLSDPKRTLDLILEESATAFSKRKIDAHQHSAFAADVESIADTLENLCYNLKLLRQGKPVDYPTSEDDYPERPH